jgi:hypothetical protein
MTLGGGIVYRALDALRIEDFQPLVGQEFRIVSPGLIESLTLVEAEASSAPPLPGLRAGFSLRFEGHSRDRWLQQAMYPVENASLGRLELFIVPLGPGPNGRFAYEAVFG